MNGVPGGAACARVGRPTRVIDAATVPRAARRARTRRLPGGTSTGVLSDGSEETHSQDGTTLGVCLVTAGRTVCDGRVTENPTARRSFTPTPTLAPRRSRLLIERLFDRRARLRRWPAACFLDAPDAPSASGRPTPASIPAPHLAEPRPTGARRPTRTAIRPLGTAARGGTAGCATLRMPRGSGRVSWSSGASATGPGRDGWPTR